MFEVKIHDTLVCQMNSLQITRLSLRVGLAFGLAQRRAKTAVWRHEARTPVPAARSVHTHIAGAAPLRAGNSCRLSLHGFRTNRSALACVRKAASMADYCTSSSVTDSVDHALPYSFIGSCRCHSRLTSWKAFRARCESGVGIAAPRRGLEKPQTPHMTSASALERVK